jgi:thiol-disulfide isomerase/thioredoxin
MGPVDWTMVWVDTKVQSTRRASLSILDPMKPPKVAAAAMLVAAFSALFAGFEALSIGEPANLFNLQAVSTRTPAMLPSFGGATGWLNSPPVAAGELKGKVVLVQFWTYSCVNWLRTLPYVRAWSDKYKDQGLVVIGVHTPEFEFEKNVDNIRRAMESMRIRYPVAVDSDYAIWRAFANDYWPALYLVDAQGRVRHSHNGEGAYEETERMLPSCWWRREKLPRPRLSSPSRPAASRPRPTSRTSSLPKPTSGTHAPRASRLGVASFPIARTSTPPPRASGATNGRSRETGRSAGKSRS